MAINSVEQLNDVCEQHDMRVEVNDGRCHAGRDGDCDWKHCPQSRDNDPKASGRHCPFDTIQYGD